MKRPWNEVQETGRFFWDHLANNGMGEEGQHPPKSLKESVRDFNEKKLYEHVMDISMLVVQLADAIDEMDEKHSKLKEAVRDLATSVVDGGRLSSQLLTANKEYLDETI